MFRLQQMDDSLRFMSVQLVLSINTHFMSELPIDEYTTMLPLLSVTFFTTLCYRTTGTATYKEKCAQSKKNN